uniref:Uncharacterized protein n=1 Tax=Branchiostoma floridae TaxID=7739 RepID=C3ZTR1_BRAFL|eukprot:XP_002588048.1 hypothetical protein BRAFLDRAFT_83028 [Branchiostoma floridae]
MNFRLAKYLAVTAVLLILFIDGTAPAPECVVPTPPLHGAVTCGVAEGAQKYCSISCDDRYDFAHEPADTYRCDWNAMWYPAEDLPWPDCSRFHRPGRARQKNELYYYSGPCTFNVEEIKRDFLRLYATLGNCSAGIRCGITDIRVSCLSGIWTDEEERNAPNLVSCPADTRITVNSTDGGLLDWTDPEFRFQPSNELANHECSANKGDAAPIGTRNVLCWAEGFADGTTCDFDIVIEAPECVVPAPPLNGAVACGVAEAGAQKYCSISCNDRYDFAHEPADTYRCDWNAVWYPAEDLPWPDCSGSYRPGRARQKNELCYFSGLCAFNEEDIKRDLQRLYATLGDCSAGIRCGIADLEVTCGMSTDEDEDECTLQTNNCDEHATCTNTPGSYTCACLEGFSGDGYTCTAERDCDSRRAKLVVWPDSATHQYLIENAKSKRNIWIGLSDRGQEGEFVWSNGDSLGSFHHWKGHNFPRAHCVAMMKRRGTYVLGVKLCAANCNYFCQRISYRPERARQKNELYYYGGTCAFNEEDIKRNLLLLYTSLGDCSAGIGCGVTDIVVTCHSGMSTDEEDVDECATGTDNCHEDASCTDTDGSFTCTCNDGYTGNGLLCGQ